MSDYKRCGGCNWFMLHTCRVCQDALVLMISAICKNKRSVDIMLTIHIRKCCNTLGADVWPFESVVSQFIWPPDRDPSSQSVSFAQLWLYALYPPRSTYNLIVIF